MAWDFQGLLTGSSRIMISGIITKTKELYWELTFLPSEGDSDLEFGINKWRGQLKEMISKLESLEARGIGKSPS